jgi:hypothetical protein
MAVKAVNTETYVIQDTKGMFEWDHSLKGPFNTLGWISFDYNIDYRNENTSNKNS